MNGFLYKTGIDNGHHGSWDGKLCRLWIYCPVEIQNLYVLRYGDGQWSNIEEVVAATIILYSVFTFL